MLTAHRVGNYDYQGDRCPWEGKGAIVSPDSVGNQEGDHGDMGWAPGGCVQRALRELGGSGVQGGMGVQRQHTCEPVCGRRWDVGWWELISWSLVFGQRLHPSPCLQPHVILHQQPSLLLWPPICLRTLQLPPSQCDQGPPSAVNGVRAGVVKRTIWQGKEVSVFFLAPLGGRAGSLGLLTQPTKVLPGGPVHGGW